MVYRSIPGVAALTALGLVVGLGATSGGPLIVQPNENGWSAGGDFSGAPGNHGIGIFHAP